MASFSSDVIAEVRERIRLEDWVGRTVRLEKRGRRWVGLCPFHSEKTPSFGVSADKQLFHCFGCGVGGDLFDYVMRLEGLGFPDAVRLLAAAAGVALTSERPEDPAERAREAHRDSMHAAHAVAQAAFRRALEGASDARRYLLEERGLRPETLERFEIGWAPPDWTYLTDELLRSHVPVEVAVEVGLVGVRARDHKPYDRLRGRVTFPIRIPSGRIAGFGARRADWIDREGPKYLNSPESPIYDKSSVLYGLHLARDDIRKRRRALLVEGYLDVILLAQAGLTEVVAGCGTALTATHAKTLARLTNEVVTLYDGDPAGQRASHRAAELLLAAGLEVRIVAMPEGMDPDDLVRKEGASALEDRITRAPSAIDFFLEQARTLAGGGGVSGTQKALEAIKPLITAIPDPLARDVAADACARELGIDRFTLRRHFKTVPPRDASGGRVSPSLRASQPHGPATGAPRASPDAFRHEGARELSHSPGHPTLHSERPSAPRPHVVEIELLKMLLEAPEQVLYALESRSALEAFSSEPMRATVRAAREGVRAGRRVQGPEALEILRSAGLTDERWLGEVRARLLSDAEPEPHELSILIERLLSEHRKRRLRAIREELAREGGDAERHDRLLEEFLRIQSGGNTAARAVVPRESEGTE